MGRLHFYQTFAHRPRKSDERRLRGLALTLPVLSFAMSTLPSSDSSKTPNCEMLSQFRLLVISREHPRRRLFLSFLMTDLL